MELWEYLIFLTLLVCLCVWIRSSRPDENKDAKKVIYKLLIYLDSIYYLLLAKENRGLGQKKNPDPAEMKDSSATLKRIIFIRHGESEWNDVFNKGFGLMGLTFVMRLIYAIYRELLMLGTLDSVFVDSPLNKEGIEQAKELRKFIEGDKLVFTQKDQMLAVMRGDTKETSVIVTSNLRRAVGTTTLALWPRINRTKEKVFILSSLQEISRNVDTRALAEAGGLPDLHKMSMELSDDGYHYDAQTVYDAVDNHGNKTLSFHGIKRMQSFNAWVFGRPESTIIVGGHSIWFQEFFKTYLPHNSDLPCKKHKIVNSGVISFSIYKADARNQNGEPMYLIDPDSVSTVFGGYQITK